MVKAEGYGLHQKFATLFYQLGGENKDFHRKFDAFFRRDKGENQTQIRPSPKIQCFYPSDFYF